MKSSEQPLVSILTPVYNGAAYLRECIESVLAQKYEHWQYTIVNNCSTDDSLAIAQEYAARDPRVAVHNNEKLLDVISNHNAAFKLISPDSKYCKVVSADDWIYPEYLCRTVALAESHPNVGLVGSYQLSGGGKAWTAWSVRWTQIPYSESVIPGREVCRVQFLDEPYVFGTPTSLLYRADLVRKYERFYPNQTSEADTSACYRCMQTSDFGFVHQVLSYERIHQQTVSATARSLNAYMPSRLCDLVEYGPSFLSEEELRKRKRELLAEYYTFLGASTFHGRDEAFWNYHKRRLKDAGETFSRVALARGAIAKALDVFLNPKQTIERARKRRA